jgi:hypothetical protein
MIDNIWVIIFTYCGPSRALMLTCKAWLGIIRAQIGPFKRSLLAKWINEVNKLDISIILYHHDLLDDKKEYIRKLREELDVRYVIRGQRNNKRAWWANNEFIMASMNGRLNVITDYEDWAYLALFNCVPEWSETLWVDKFIDVFVTMGPTNVDIWSRRIFLKQLIIKGKDSILIKLAKKCPVPDERLKGLLDLINYYNMVDLAKWAKDEFNISPQDARSGNYAMNGSLKIWLE